MTCRGMPAEWAPHERTWMAWPTANSTFAGADELATARAAWARVAATVARFEPVVVAVDPADAGGTAALDSATAGSPHPVTTVAIELDDAWMRDIGPTFVHGADGLHAVDWEFNGWGAQDWARWARDGRVASRVTAIAGSPLLRPGIVNEGGGFHVDGRGTVLLTDTVQLDPARNPGATRAGIERRVHAAIGTSHAVWLPRGLTRDYDRFGTRGHVDVVAAFAAGGQVLVHHQGDPSHPDSAVTAEVIDTLKAATDAAGRPFRIVELPAPTRGFDPDGAPNDWSYVNHYVCNGAVVLCGFDDAHDAIAAGILADVYPDRRIELVDARDIFAFGGGVHCITQQQPAA